MLKPTTSDPAQAQFGRRAVIDVGTNSVKLLVADVQGREIRPVSENSKQTRLGRGFYQEHRLQAEAIANTAEAVARFAAEARQYGARSVRVIATSAARDAKNSGELSSAIEQACGLSTEIITGEQEADWAFQGVTCDPQFAQVPILLLDVGGGSTEFILGQGTQKHFARSYPLGTVRLMETSPHSDPPTPNELRACREFIRQFLDQHVRPEVARHLARESAAAPGGDRVQLVGTGGTMTILARMHEKTEDFDRERIEGVRLGLEAMRTRVDSLWSMSLAERKRIIGLPKNRADVILTGSAICEAVMEVFGFSTLRISTRGLRFAALMEEIRQ